MCDPGSVLLLSWVAVTVCPASKVVNADSSTSANETESYAVRLFRHAMLPGIDELTLTPVKGTAFPSLPVTAKERVGNLSSRMVLYLSRVIASLPMLVMEAEILRPPMEDTLVVGAESSTERAGARGSRGEPKAS